MSVDRQLDEFVIRRTPADGDEFGGSKRATHPRSDCSSKGRRNGSGGEATGAFCPNYVSPNSPCRQGRSGLVSLYLIDKVLSPGVASELPRIVGQNIKHGTRASAAKVYGQGRQLPTGWLFGDKVTPQQHVAGPAYQRASTASTYRGPARSNVSELFRGKSL